MYGQSLRVMPLVGRLWNVSKATAAAPSAFRAAQSRMSSSWRLTDSSVAGGEAEQLRAANHRRELLEDRDERLIGGDGDRHAVKVVVGPQRRIHLARLDRRREAAVRGAHRLQVVLCEAPDGLPHGHLVHRGHDVARVADGAGVE